MSPIRPFGSTVRSGGIQVVPAPSPAESFFLAALIRPAVALTLFPVISAEPIRRPASRLDPDTEASSGA
jgi:hypothetical protein